MRANHPIGKKEPHIIGLMLLAAFALMGALILTPTLNKISSFFKVNQQAAEMTVSIFLLGYAAGQLVYGPLSNRYGRKKAVYIGIAIATLGSLFSILAAPIESFSLLLFGRFLEAIGSSAGLVVSMTIINDFYKDQKQRKRKMTALMLGFALVPGAAIFISGFIVQYLDWRYCFYFLLLYGLSLLISTAYFPETLIESDPHALKIKKIILNYFNQFKKIRLIGFGVCVGLANATVYLFGVKGPLIALHLGMPAASYGTLGIIPYLGGCLSCLISTKLSHIKPIRFVQFGFLFQLIGTIMMLVFFFIHQVTLITLLFPMLFVCAGQPLLGASAMLLGTNESHDKSNGSAVVTFLAIFIPTIMTFLLALLNIKSPIVLPSLMLLSLALMLTTYFTCRLMK
jgi:DHA1 family bicyclomycin/chloramphenicol resistance-like MFS transporter